MSLLSRRELLGKALGSGALMASGLWRPAWAADPLPTPPAKARAVIQIWLWGGACHLDTFDPKPEAGVDYCGPYNKPLTTDVPGLRLNQLLPQLAKLAPKYSILRGMTHGLNSHETAAYMVQTGRRSGDGISCPGLGAMVSLLKGRKAGYKGNLPPYIVLTQPQGRFPEEGFLEAEHKPFATGGNPAKDPFAVEGLVSAEISDRRQKDRRSLLAALDTFARERSTTPLVAALTANRERAWDLILGDAAKVFALEQEPAGQRDRYGRNTFGQSCLAARRLVEAGVLYVTINHPGWDTHKKHFEAMGRKLPELDQGLSALLLDLSARGLLDSTIVWVGGEFGRTPKVQREPPWNGGRGHHGAAFSHLVAGGGLAGGKVVGATDSRGETVIERPIWPWDLMATFLQQLGIDPATRLPHPQGRMVTAAALAPGQPPPKQTGGPLRELI